MTTSSAAVSLPAFSKLGPRISLYSPSAHAAGELVIICTWLGAAKKHIAKYVSSYQDISPLSKILLIESAVPILVSSYSAQQEAIKPAVHAVRAVLDECRNGADSRIANPPKILLHTFSNGGTSSATQMLIVLGKQLGAPLPLVGIVCDSGPAKGDYWKSYNAMVLSLPKGFARAVGPIVVHIILILLFASVAAGRYDKPEDLFRRTLLDERLIEDSAKEKGKICYISSKTDVMVDWRDIADHAKMAREKGWDVKELIFEDTAHCNHFAKHENEYSDKLRRLWEGGRLSDEPRSRL